MSDKKSNAPLIIIVVLAVLALPCLLVVAGLGGYMFLNWPGNEAQIEPAMQSAPSMAMPMEGAQHPAVGVS